MDAHHLTRPPPPRLGFCLSRGFARGTASVGADGPISEYNSRDMPSGFRVFSSVFGVLLSCEGPGVEGLGRDSILRTSAAEAPAMVSTRRRPSQGVAQRYKWRQYQNAGNTSDRYMLGHKIQMVVAVQVRFQALCSGSTLHQTSDYIDH